jgi:hypothetical protein
VIHELLGRKAALPLHFWMMRGKSSPNSVSQLEK